MGRVSIEIGGHPRPSGPKSRPEEAEGEEDLPPGFWFGGGVTECWKNVYASFSLAQLREEEAELWEERERLAGSDEDQTKALRALRLRIALVEDRMREIVGSYS